MVTKRKTCFEMVLGILWLLCQNQYNYLLKNAAFSGKKIHNDNL